MRAGKRSWSWGSGLRLWGVLAMLAGGACQKPGPNPRGGPEHGRLELHLAAPSQSFDLARVRFEVTNSNGHTQSSTVLLETEGLPGTLNADLAGHTFADWFVVLNPGTYQIRATPLDQNGDPSEHCEAAEAEAEVFPETTVELVLVSSCRTGASGALDTVLVLDRTPFISELELKESKFICHDEALEMSATAQDESEDSLVWSWELVDAPQEGQDIFCLTSSGSEAAFSALVPGRYTLSVTASDGTEEARLRFPVYVSQCANPAPSCPGEAIQELQGSPPNTFSGHCVCERVSPPTVTISPDIAPALETVPDPQGGEPRPVVRYENARGKHVDFVANELIVTSDDDAALEAFLRTQNARLVETMDFSALTTGGPRIHRVSIVLAQNEMSRFAQEWRDSAGATGLHTFSSSSGPQLFQTALDAMSDTRLHVGLNILLETPSFATRETTEAGAGTTRPGLSPFTSDAFAWPYMSRGSTQDIGTAEAWRVLDAMGRLDNRVRIAIVDSGFIPNPDFPGTPTFAGPLRVPNTNACGASGGPSEACRWHGTHVLMSAMAEADNGEGAAGPAGPVAEAIVLQTPAADFFAISSFILSHIPTALSARPQIINLSGSANLPVEACLAVLGGVPVCEVLHEVSRAFRAAGSLVLAAAGNRDEGESTANDVDATKEFGLCPFCFTAESDIVIPCELDQVVCVGGLAWDATTRHPGSDFGSQPTDAHTVDIYGPFEVWSVGDPEAADSNNPSPNTDAAIVGGTSFATPYVAGVAGLIWAANPSFGPNDVERILMETAHTGSGDPEVPRWVNALGAVQRAVGGDTPPFLEITSPANGATILANTFTGLSANAEDLETSVSVVWRLDGVEIARGASVTARLDASFGTHTLEAQAFDTTGNASPVDSIEVTLTNAPPTVEIVAPRSSEERCQDQDIIATGQITDPNGDPGPTAGSWFVNGVLSGTGTTLRITAGTLAIGRQELEYSVTDGAFVRSFRTNFQVVDCSGAPVRILAPLDGRRFALGQSVSFDANFVSGINFNWEIIPDDTGTPLPKLCAPPPLPRDGYSCGDLQFNRTFRDRVELGGYTIRFTAFVTAGAPPEVDEVRIEIVTSL